MFRLSEIRKIFQSNFLEACIVFVVLYKILESDLDYTSAAILLPVCAVHIVRSVIVKSKNQTIQKIEEFKAALEIQKQALQIMDSNQKEVFKQAEEAKSVISKFNLASAFAGRTSR